MNTIRISVVFACISLWLRGSEADKLNIVWTPRVLHESWVVRGKIVAYDPGLANDRFFWNAVYFDNSGRAWPLLGGYWNIVQMLRCEFPDGIDLAFAQTKLVTILTEFSAGDGLIADNNVIDQVIDSQAHLSRDGEAQKLVRELLEKPKVTILGNNWSARFLTIAVRERVRINVIKGIMKPFSIQSEVVETLTDECTDNFTIARLRAALERKNAMLERVERWR
jgi:hypothetical protein